MVVRHAVVSPFWHWWTCYVLYASTLAQRLRPHGNTYNNPLFNTQVKLFSYALDFKAMCVGTIHVGNKWEGQSASEMCMH